MADLRTFMLINGKPECISEEWRERYTAVASGSAYIQSMDLRKLSVLAALVVCGYHPLDNYAMSRDTAKLIVEIILSDAKVEFVSEEEHNKLLEKAGD